MRLLRQIGDLTLFQGFLRALAARKGTTDKFRLNLEELRGRHATKPTLIERIRKAGLLT